MVAAVLLSSLSPSFPYLLFRFEKSKRSQMEIKNAKHRLAVDDANLQDSTFENVNLSDAMFHDVNMASVVFNDVNLSGGKFTNVNLCDVEITGCDLTGMTIDG